MSFDGLSDKEITEVGDSFLNLIHRLRHRDISDNQNENGIGEC